MPFKIRLKRTRRYDVSSKHLYVVSVQLLDNTLIECTLSTESTGIECLENIGQRIELQEIQYFGLRYFNKKLQLHWVDLDKPLKKQLEKNDHSPMLYFGVMLYVSDIQRLGDDMARYQYYLQLKHDILEGHVPCHQEQAVILASYSIQAEFGDHDFTRHTLEYFKEFALLPKSLTMDEQSYSVLVDEALATHRSLQGLAPVAAELHYIMAAMQLDGYGVECYPGKDDTGSDLILGASYAGLFVKHLGGQTTVYFKWDDIKHLTHHRKSFLIQTCLDQQNVKINMDDTEIAKYIWRMCVTQHKFFRFQKELSSARSSQSTKSVSSSDGRQPSQTIPDIQRSVQQSLQSDPQQFVQYGGMQQTAHYQDPQIQGEYEGGLDYQQTQIPIMPGYEQTTPDGSYSGNPVVNGSIYDVEHAQVVLGSQNNLSTVAATPIQGVQAPEYRPSPDYELVMQQRMAQQQNYDQLSLTQSMTVSNIGNMQVYNHPEHLAYSQPEMGQAVQYEHQLVNPLHRGFNIAYSHPVVEHGIASKPIERVSSLVIQPTYSTPELNVQVPVQQSASETVIPQSVVGYRQPPSYARPSSSTPDLATHTVKPNFNPPPDLLSRRNIDLSELLAQSRLDQSLENLAGNLQNIDLCGDFGKHRSRTLDSVSSGSNATFHAKDVETASEDDELDHMEYPYTDRGYDVRDGRMEMTETNDLTYEQMLHREQDSQSDDAGQCESGSEYDSVAEIENPIFVDNPSGSEIECLDVSKVSDMTLSVGHSKDSSVDAGAVIPSEEDAGKGDELAEEAKDDVAQALKGEGSEEEDDEDAVKWRSMGPLKMAHLNGLTISRAQIMFAQNDESRAPKDDRRKNLESKLEEGQVFVEFEKIPKKVTTAECRVALNPENLSKNRFKDVHPYDSSRVRLKPKSSNSSGYINASHIRVRVKGQELWYIASQAPLENTTEDFWQMVWEQDVQVIAMLTQLRELGKEKCFPYWPTTPGSKNKKAFGEFQVSLKFSNDSLCYVTNGFNLKHKGSGKERMVWHLQYTDWPDHGCPDDVHGFLAFLEEIESVNRHIAIENPASEKKYPTLIHCSAGVGRAGVAILVEVMKTCLEFNQNVDIPTVLATLRGQRMHMVQTVSQYTFVYKTLIQYLKNSRLI